MLKRIHFYINQLLSVAFNASVTLNSGNNIDISLNADSTLSEPWQALRVSDKPYMARIQSGFE